MSKTNIFPLGLGLAVGVMLSYMFFQYETISKKSVMIQPLYYGKREYSMGGHSFYLQRKSPDNKTMILPVDNKMTRLVKSFPFDPLLNSSLLEENMRMLCYIMCAKCSKQAIHAVQDIMGRHCDKVVVFAKSADGNPGTVGLNFKTTEDMAWQRYKMATEYVYHQFRLDYDLFIKHEYDTLVVSENIRFMTLLHQAYIPGYVGHVLTDVRDRGVVTALTRDGLSILKEAIPSCAAQKGGKKEDVELAECLRHNHVHSVKESKDTEGVPRLQMLIPDHELPANTLDSNPWYVRHIHHPLVEVSFCT